MRSGTIRKNPAAMPPVPLRHLLAAVAVAALLAAGGCGSGQKTTVDDDRPVAIAMSEFRLSPQDLRLPEGRRTLEVRNEGTMVHRFEIRSADGTRRFVLGAPLKPGASERLAVDLPRGDYVMRCAQERHNTLGEHGTLSVD